MIDIGWQWPGQGEGLYNCTLFNKARIWEISIVVVNIDTSVKFEEIYEFRDKIARG